MYIAWHLLSDLFFIVQNVLVSGLYLAHPVEMMEEHVNSLIFQCV